MSTETVIIESLPDDEYVIVMELMEQGYTLDEALEEMGLI